MESIICAALEEICVHGAGGITLADLWRRLHGAFSAAGFHLCAAVKSVVFSRLLANPAIRFDPPLKSLEEANEAGVRVVAAEHLRDSLLGIDDLKYSNHEISKDQRRTLERIALARNAGVTQSDLAKEFGISGNNFFYVVKSLECHGLVVRQSTMVMSRDHETDGEKGLSNNPLHTNLLRLYRYGKDKLNSQLRFEITKPDMFGNSDNIVRGSPKDAEASDVKEDVHVKDFLPAMKAICDKLEEAQEKVLVISDIKQSLNYRLTQGHRAWRNVLHRLKDAGLVEEFMAKVNGKEVSCLRLLNKYDPNKFQTKTFLCGYDGFESENTFKQGKRGEVTEQFVELPLEHRVYDLIDEEGPKGIIVVEVAKRLGINAKRLYNRIVDMQSKYGLHLLPEMHKRTKIYRVWTAGNYQQYLANINRKFEDFSAKDGPSSQSMNISPSNRLSPYLQLLHTQHCNKMSIAERATIGHNGMELAVVSSACTENDPGIPQPGDSLDDRRLSDHGSLVETSDSNIVSEDNPSSNAITSSKRRCSRRYPSMVKTVVDVSREQRIVDKLKNEKFILSAELYRWLEELEKGKSTTMARKTLTRILNELQRKGLCKCHEVIFPGVANCSRPRKAEVILHPSIKLTSDILDKIHEKQRLFDAQVRGTKSLKSMNKEAVTMLEDVKLPSRPADGSMKLEALSANGFVIPKMIRAKLLHSFLWGYVSRLPDWQNNLSSIKHDHEMNNSKSTYHLFALQTALKAMPVELFLQVAGTQNDIDNLVEICKSCLRLVDLPDEEYRKLMDPHADQRLSGVINILMRLKLIRLVMEGSGKEFDTRPHAVLTHAMELRPYIEEPPRSLPSSNINVSHRVEHNFFLSDQAAVDKYWKTLESCYSRADQAVATGAFPGSVVHEVFNPRSWSSVRVMTVEQRTELVKRMESYNPKKKISVEECGKIAQELNLAIEQVLRFSYDRRQSNASRHCISLESIQQETSPTATKVQSGSRKRKRGSESMPTKRVIHDVEGKEMGLSCTANMEDLQHHYENHESNLHANPPKDLEPCGEDGEIVPIINQCAISSMKRRRATKFNWTESAERKLVMQYARYRAMHGAGFHRVLWDSISDLPAPSSSSSKRMATFRGDEHTRKAVMRLCNLLAERFARFQHRSQTQDCFGGSAEASMSDCWDDFDDPIVRAALDEVLQCRRMAKLDAKRFISYQEKEWSDITATDKLNVECVDRNEKSPVSSNPGLGAGGHRLKTSTCTAPSTSRRLRSKHLHHKFFKGSDITFKRRVYESVAVANAVELLKVFFLNSSPGRGLQSSLTKILKLYSDNDLLDAFNYLKGKEFVVIGQGNRSCVLSQKFWHSASSSPFPVDTGRRAANMSRWIAEKEIDLMDVGLTLHSDLQCGEIFQLFALVCSGEVCISPCMPKVGVGEDCKHKSLKRKTNDVKPSGRNVKKHKPLKRTDFGNPYRHGNRREKGFPGINIILNRVMTPAFQCLNFDNHVSPTCECSPKDSFFTLDNLEPNVHVDDMLWHTMADYVKQCSAILPSKCGDGNSLAEVIKTINSAIYEAGEQGLGMEDISGMLPQGSQLAEVVVDSLEVFHLVIKVNAYACYRVVDSVYRSKYRIPFVNKFCGLSTNVKGWATNSEASQQPKEIPGNSATTHDAGEDCSTSSHEIMMVQQVEPASSCMESVSTKNGEEDIFQDSLQNLTPEDNNYQAGKDYHTSLPILPWVNGDGTINNTIYNGLMRRILGMVMQNPGILEDDIIHRMDVLNPQSCRKLLETLLLDKHLIVRIMNQTAGGSPPSVLASLLESKFTKPQPVFKRHFFANLMRSQFL